MWWCTDRSHGSQYTQHIEDIHRGLDDYVGSLEKELSYRQQTIEQLEQSELFYDIQYGEAKIVANVCALCQFSVVSLALHGVMYCYMLSLMCCVLVIEMMNNESTTHMCSVLMGRS